MSLIALRAALVAVALLGCSSSPSDSNGFPTSERTRTGAPVEGAESDPADESDPGLDPEDPIPEDPEESEPTPPEQDDDSNVPTTPGQCCVWIDLDNTLNTVGAWGYPFNPVPAAELCTILSGYGPDFRATPLTARKGCASELQPGESECAFLQKTVSVECSSGATAANNKKAYMRSVDDQCRKHILIDDNTAASGIVGGQPPIQHIKPLDFDWTTTRQMLVAAFDGC